MITCVIFSKGWLTLLSVSYVLVGSMCLCTALRTVLHNLLAFIRVFIQASHKAAIIRIRGPNYYEPSVLSINLKTHNNYRLDSKVHNNNFCVENKFFPKFSILSHDLTCLLCISVAHVKIT